VHCRKYQREGSEPVMSAPLRRLMKDPNVITDLLSVADSGLRFRFERTQSSSSAGSIGRQKEPVAHPDRRRLANRWSLRRLGEIENGDDADTHRAKTMERSKRRRSQQSHQHRARSRRSSGWSLNRPIDHAVDLARHDEIILVQSLDLLGA
jgi:hypothetical protein